MSRRYLIRLDDACPVMDSSKWLAIERILDKHGIAPLVGIVPHCEDPAISINNPDSSFWIRAKSWHDKGWNIALHGYNHVYTSKDSGINPLWQRSEFAGLSLDSQRSKIREGMAILNKYGIIPTCFFAPSHTFDLNTLEALRLESNIRIISDTIALKPYEEHGFTFVPCQIGHFTEIPFSGVWTFCFHPNIMSEDQISNFDAFINKNRGNFISWSNLDLSCVGKKTFCSKVLSNLYFTYRKLRKLL